MTNRLKQANAVNPPAAAPAAGPELGGLDPQDWPAFTAVAHTMLDEALALVKGVRDQPVWQPMPGLVKHALDEPMPLDPQGAERAGSEAAKLILPYPTGNIHPRFFGWVHGSGTAGGIIAEMLAAAMNANAGGRDHGAIHVERQVVDWFRGLFGFSQEASGLLVSGTSMATLIALTVARNTAIGAGARRLGLASAAAPLVAYSSSEAHSSVARAMEMLGLGSEALRPVKTDAEFRLDTDALRAAIRADKARGNRPFAVIATAGTVNTGAIDPLAAIADVCAEEGLWMHVDGAFGALAQLSDALRPRLAGIERAHSLAFDFHKWLHVPYDAGCVLVRDGAAHRDAFASRPGYLAPHARGLAAGEPWPCDFGPELSRGFRALKVWFTLKEHGTRKLAAAIEDNCRLARLLGERVAADPRLELLAPVSLNIACFRYRADDLPPPDQDRLNEDIVAELQERGIAAPSTTRIAGRLAIRVNITNHRTRDSDIGILLEALLDAGDRLVQARRSSLPNSSPASMGEDKRQRFPFVCLTVLDEALSRPEIGVACDGLAVRIEAGSGPGFSVAGRTGLLLRPAGLRHAAAAGVLARHGAELLRLGAAASPAARAAVAMLAARTAGCYLAVLPEAERLAAEQHLQPTLLCAYRQLARSHSAADVAGLAARNDGTLVSALTAAGAAETDIAVMTNSVAARIEALNLFASRMAVAPPPEHLLTHGGDTRIKINPRTGRNSYGSSARPTTGEIGFSSSTATCVSTEAYASVEDLRRRLTMGGSDFVAEIERIRSAVLRHSGADRNAGTELALTASGTDAELATLALALAGGSRPLTSIVISPEETGSGVPQATLGRHFSTETANGHSVEAGGSIAGFAEQRVRSVHVAIRDAKGSARSLAVVRDEVFAAADTATAKGERVLLHVLDAAKTGIGAPDLRDVAELAARHGNAIDVVVDACQARLGPEAVAAYLAKGWLVQITGSKFWGGPPFSGGLLVPPNFVARRVRLAPLLGSLGGYMGRNEWPRAFAPARDALPDTRNLGLVCRWQAAVFEIERFASIPAPSITELIRVYMRAARDALNDYPELKSVDGLPIEHAPICADDTWRDLRSIVPFVPTRNGAPLTFDEAKLLHRALAHDASAMLGGFGLGPEYLRLAAQPCHLGQPVKLGTAVGGTTGALRICASVRTIAAMGEPGGTEALSHDLDRALAKTRLLLENFEALKA